MKGYLGETPVDVSKHPKYSKYTQDDWAVLFITKYGSIDGDHHKQWCLDTVVRLLLGTPVIVTQARWKNGQTEDRFVLAEPPSQAYLDWVKSMTSGVNAGYDYDPGIAP